mmetsp:Transcript_11349/g.20691  ORF Transcript_11349/g.20691 Transcript_11349/m.20691 type:complete len:218 (+) Transcript_11349:4669-5322(+)
MPALSSEQSSEGPAYLEISNDLIDGLALIKHDTRRRSRTIWLLSLGFEENSTVSAAVCITSTFMVFPTSFIAAPCNATAICDTISERGWTATSGKPRLSKEFIFRINVFLSFIVSGPPLPFSKSQPPIMTMQVKMTWILSLVSRMLLMICRRFCLLSVKEYGKLLELTSLKHTMRLQKELPSSVTFFKLREIPSSTIFFLVPLATGEPLVKLSPHAW